VNSNCVHGIECQIPTPHGHKPDLYSVSSIVAEPRGQDGLLTLEQPSSFELDLDDKERLVGENQSGAGKDQERHAEERELGAAAGQRPDQAGSGQRQQAWSSGRE
jgi:hypothetical protein